MSELIERLQPFMRESKVFRAIFEADENQLAARKMRNDDIMLQLSVDTATWGLAIFENEYGIPVDEKKPIGERRSLIKSKMRGSGTVNAALMESVALSFTGGEISISFVDGKINITFTDILGTPPNIDDFMVAIDEIKPAFLDVVYIYLYNQYRELMGFTHDHLSQYTYEQLHSFEIT